MAQVSLRDWLALLSEAGVKFKSGSRLRTAVESAAQRLELELDSQDLATLMDLEDALSPVRDPNGGFARMVVCHIPQLPDVPSQPVPSDGDGRGPPLYQSAALPNLPPWGRMEATLEAQMDRAKVPIHWNPPDGAQVTMKKWKEWRGGLIAGIDSLLWPQYKPGATSWNTPSIARLLDADFQLLLDLQFNLGMPIEALFPTKVVHNDLFKEEDDGSIEFGTGYDRYDPTLMPVLLRELTTVLIAGMADKVGTLDLQLKQVFQRPRAYQVALLQERDNFAYRWGRTGNTPSLPSGHCLQACVAGCTAYIAYAKYLSDDSIRILKHFTVDVGDRRVFAGVHYPSDNLASWYVAMNLLSRVFDGEHEAKARHFLWSAIEDKSKVFAAVRAHIDADGSSPYKKIVDEIRRLGSADR